MNKKIVTLLLIVGGLFLGSVASADYCSVAFFNGANFSNSIRRVLLTGNNFTLDKETSAEAGFSLFPHYNHYTT